MATVGRQKQNRCNRVQGALPGGSSYLGSTTIPTHWQFSGAEHRSQQVRAPRERQHREDEPGHEILEVITHHLI
jgi:hypothetical protein